MKTVTADPARWKDAAGDLLDPGQRAAALAEAARPVPALAPEALARIRGAVLARGASRIGARPSLALRFAVLAILVLVSAATAMATVTMWRLYVARPSKSEVTTPPPAERSRPPARARQAEPPVVPPSPAPVSAPVGRSSARRPHRAPVGAASASHVARVTMSLPAPEATAAVARAAETEAQLIGRALVRLRQAHDPAGALAVLDEYAAAFPTGTLDAEALSARLEAVLLLNDRATALRLLDGHKGFAGRLGWQQLLTRAELRASAGRYDEALGDFDRLLTSTATVRGGEVERALYGRAVCLGHLGRDERARADLRDYARRFPGGTYATEVARLLAGSRPDARP